MKKQARQGDDLEQFLEEEGLLEEVRAGARKKIIAYQLRMAMKAKKITPAEMARRMKTSRPAVYRLLDAKETAPTLDTLERASAALGLELQVRFVARPRKKAA